MGIYYYAVDVCSKKYFSPPPGYSVKSPGIYHPDNPFSHMVVMMNSMGSKFDIWNDCRHDIPPSDGFKEVTQEVYEEYIRICKENDWPIYD